tara:strand:+ start:1180 stop:1590 length:411 start_codon:yes stop_codon:yes gene_type:complete
MKEETNIYNITGRPDSSMHQTTLNEIDGLTKNAVTDFLKKEFPSTENAHYNIHVWTVQKYQCPCCHPEVFILLYIDGRGTINELSYDSGLYLLNVYFPKSCGNIIFEIEKPEFIIRRIDMPLFHYAIDIEDKHPNV